MARASVDARFRTFVLTCFGALGLLLAVLQEPVHVPFRVADSTLRRRRGGEVGWKRRDSIDVYGSSEFPPDRSFKRRRRQVVRQRSAKPPSPVQIRAAPPSFVLECRRRLPAVARSAKVGGLTCGFRLQAEEFELRMKPR